MTYQEEEEIANIVSNTNELNVLKQCNLITKLNINQFNWEEYNFNYSNIVK